MIAGTLQDLRNNTREIYGWRHVLNTHKLGTNNQGAMYSFCFSAAICYDVFMACFPDASGTLSSTIDCSSNYHRRCSKPSCQISCYEVFNPQSHWHEALDRPLAACPAARMMLPF